MDLYFNGDKSTMLIYKDDLKLSLLNYNYDLDEIKLIDVTYSDFMASKLYELLLPMMKNGAIISYDFKPVTTLKWFNHKITITDKDFK